MAETATDLRGDTPTLMGVLNVTPDSFSDGGRFAASDDAFARGLALLDEGADWLDVGGESTRPGADPVSAPEEIDRVVPVIERILAERPDTVISVDTSKAEVAAAAIGAGARVLNDVTALADGGMGPLCAAAGVTVVLMHMRGTPGTMQQDTHYADVVAEVVDFLARRAETARAQGIDPAHIVVDPGLGFGKSHDDNPRLIAAIPRLAALGYPVLIGASRKAFVGTLTGRRHPTERVAGSIGAALAAAEAGAAILRVHDVAATADALAVYRACRGVR